jgi:osmotically-inducible protein OsmY
MDDKALQEAVMRELHGDPAVDAAHIGVAAAGGAVTLTGHVSSFAQKWAAVQAAERVEGVVAVVDDLIIELPGTSLRDDVDIAEDIARRLRSNGSVPDTVNAEIRRGHVTLRGEVEWSYQREAAEREVRNTPGVTGITNLITITPKVEPDQLKERIADAIERMADLDAHRIEVLVDNDTVHLRGRVHTWYEKRLAEREAAAVPGVSRVDNQIVVEAA